MTHDELTALWREAGCPWVQGMQCGSYVVDAVYNGKSYVDDGEYPTPDWGNPMVEFALMCAAEQAAGCRLVYRREEMDDCPDYWTIETDTGETPDCFGVSYKAPETRIECALRVIIACRESDG